jgi:hypothetical protein
MDCITVAPGAGVDFDPKTKVRSDAAVVVCTWKGEDCSRVFAVGGTQVTVDGKATRIPQTLLGTVRAVDYSAGTVTVESEVDLSSLVEAVERPARFYNSDHSSIHQVVCARDGDARLLLRLKDPSILTGKLRVTSCDAEPRQFATSSFCPHAINLAGMHVAGEDMSHLARIVSVARGQIELDRSGDAAAGVSILKAHVGRDVWVADFGPGDRVEIEGMLYRDSTSP